MCQFSGVISLLGVMDGVRVGVLVGVAGNVAHRRVVVEQRLLQQSAFALQRCPGGLHFAAAVLRTPNRVSTPPAASTARALSAWRLEASVARVLVTLSNYSWSVSYLPLHIAQLDRR